MQTTSSPALENVTGTSTILRVEHLEIPQIALAAWNFDEVAIYITITLFVLAVVLLKIFYHKLTYVASYIPESLLLIVVGLIFGAIIHYVPTDSLDSTQFRLSPQLFFNILLPPIVLEAAYNLYNKTFADLLGPILLFAVFGTVLNFLLIGGGIFAIDLTIGLGAPYLGLGLKEYLLFASLIVAVDPVAVLAIFQDIGVDLELYYIVFGESLLNDAVTVVLYNIMSAFVATTDIGTTQVLTGIGSFFTVSLGGALIGILHGVVSCLLTRMKISSEAIVPLLMSYLSYIVGDMFGWSGIIAIIVCGVFQAAYAFHNLTPLSVIFLKSSVKQIASISEAIIFLLIGSEVFAVRLKWHTGFILSALIICLTVRTVVVFFLTAIINHYRTPHTRIRWSEQIIISYGGLRGAVSFSLAILLKAHFLGIQGELAKDVLVTTTILVIFFTVAFMGTTMKPIVRLLNIRLASETSQKLFVALNGSVLDHCLLYVEQMTSSHGYNRFRLYIRKLDDKYIRPLLQRNAITHDNKIIAVYEKMALQMHSDAISSHTEIVTADTKDKEEEDKEEEDEEDDLDYKKTEISLPNRFARKSVAIQEAEDKMRSSTYPSRMPTHIRRRVRIASLINNECNEIYFPYENVFSKASNAQFARYGRHQANLAESMDHYIRKRSTRSHSYNEDSSLTVKKRRARFARLPTANTETVPAGGGKAFLLASRKYRDSSLADTPEDPFEEEAI